MIILYSFFLAIWMDSAQDYIAMESAQVNVHSACPVIFAQQSLLDVSLDELLVSHRGHSIHRHCCYILSSYKQKLCELFFF